mgnify:CR=1 FL=1
MNKNHYVAIMAGGIGSRFWPMSRADYPKQFLDILNTGRTLIQSTFDRFMKFIPLENIYIVTAENYKDIVKEQLPELDEANILSEPSRKNTAPCIAYISYKLYQLNPSANLICAPADHLITDDAGFKKVCMEALHFTAHIKALTTLGIKPTNPNTGYGYIQYEQLAVSDNIFKVKTFTEKPDRELAKTFVASGDFLWNAGIFVWQVKNIIKAFEKLLPEMHEVFDAEKANFNTPAEKEAIDRIYPQCVNISIDYGVMEKAENVYTIPSQFGWSDVGSWDSLYEVYEHDYWGNAVKGKNVKIYDSMNNMIMVGDEKMVVVQGIKNLCVVDTADVLLICERTKEQEIKQITMDLKQQDLDRYL